ncbi:coumaroyl-CoA:anthocyanidin 3-O-glucoside-6''-O-coumaroyltransferase 2-like [Actinidia eriantha]|uniref:coumaroyl-CoA:anthocyanidin 3-O-glucoside-6''-O-coumaroyltransferase 2-like n=1 Tax=Actinidia eriantha TaxID=165200 RepID=UPI00258B8E17|nr:coumaroyl-CoA:anthocyanidin 3-O-glucoside-6''-O-coumaroyltransferase 2-like [Actinidia eriantha]
MCLNQKHHLVFKSSTFFLIASTHISISLMAPLHNLKVLERCEISPPQGLVPTTTLPLTFFDIPWLLFTPSQPLFFYEFSHSTTTFTHSIVPYLKQSLSLTLQQFFPLAGSLKMPPQPAKPHLDYTAGDSVDLTIAESAANFDHLSGHHPRDALEFHHLVPSLPPSLSCDPHVQALLAVQVTLFPKCGICIGFSFCHVAGDGRTFDNFLKSWASICKILISGAQIKTYPENKLYNTYSNPIVNFSMKEYKMPSYERSMIKDSNGLEPMLLKQWWDLRNSEAHIMGNYNIGTSLKDMVRATFVVGRHDMEKLKKWILTLSNKIFGSCPLYLSPYVITCAYVWTCLTKVRCPNTKSLGKEPHYFGFIAGGITRLDYPVSKTYFGNCVSFGRSVATGHELVGEDGVVIAAKAIGDTVEKLNGEVLGGAENWILDWKELFGSDLHVVVTGSPKLGLYGLDFGWGKPKKIEEICIDKTNEVSLTESIDVEGGIEVGLVLPKSKMDAFRSLFNEGLNCIQ